MYVGHTMSAALDYPLLDHIAMYVVTEYRYDNPIKLCFEMKSTTYKFGQFTSISGHFFANNMNIFHKI